MMTGVMGTDGDVQSPSPLSPSLLHRHQLSFDVRRDLYQCCHQWACAVASNGRFLGGENPCLADLVGSASWDE